MEGRQNENLHTTVPFIRPKTNPINITALCSNQCFAAIAVSLALLVDGFSLGYMSKALPSLQDRTITSFEVTSLSLSWVGGAMSLANSAGAILCGLSVDYLGRRNTIIVTIIPFIVSWLLIACATNISMVIVGRSITGLCVGITSISWPLYLCESIQAEVRGTLGLLPTTFSKVGTLLCLFAGLYMNWSSLAFLGCALTIPFLISMFLIPETPRWFVSKGKQQQARKALQWLRSTNTDVEPELKDIIETRADALKNVSRTGIKHLVNKWNLKPLSILIGLMFFKHFSGNNFVMFYAMDIFIRSSLTIETSNVSIIFGVVNLIATLVALILIDRLGRKILLYISSVGIIVTISALGVCFYVENNSGWLPLASLLGNMFCFSLGYGPIPMLMLGELLPVKNRGLFALAVIVIDWLIKSAVTSLFAHFIVSIGVFYGYWFYVLIGFIGLVFVIRCVPETGGKSLEIIEREIMRRE